MMFSSKTACKIISKTLDMLIMLFELSKIDFIKELENLLLFTEMQRREGKLDKQKWILTLKKFTK